MALHAMLLFGYVSNSCFVSPSGPLGLLHLSCLLVLSAGPPAITGGVGGGWHWRWRLSVGDPILSPSRLSGRVRHACDVLFYFSVLVLTNPDLGLTLSLA